MMARAASAVVRHRRWIIAGWTMIALTLAPLARGVQDHLETNVRIPHSESARVDELLSSAFATRFARFAVLVIRGLPPVTTDSGRAMLRHVLDDVRASPNVMGTLSALDDANGDSLLAGEGGATFAVIGLDPARRQDSMLAELRARTEAASRRLPGVELMWTGAGPLTVDLRRASANDAARAERRIMPLTLGLLIVAFGAVIAAALPIAAGALSIAITMGITAIIARHFPLSVLVVNVSTMLGLGLGIDYALLTVSRFREARRRNLDASAAAVDAATHAGKSILLSGGTVLLGFAALLLVPLSDLRSMAVGGLLVTLTSVLVAVTLLPAILATWSTAVERGRVRRFHGQRGWRRWSIGIVRRPIVVLAACTVVVAPLVWQARRLERRQPSGDWLPPAMESARGLEALRAMHRANVIQAIRVVLEFPPGVDALSPEGWHATVHAAERIAADRRIARVRSIPSVAGTPDPPRGYLANAPGDLIATFVGRGGRRALVEVLPADGATPRDVMELVRDLRRGGNTTLTGRADVLVSIGGLAAFNVDYEDAITGATARVVALVVAGTLIALMVGFRSILVPVKAVVLNLVTVGASFGLMVLVFQSGHGARMLGLQAPLDGVFTAVPLLVFCIMFGLSMDYEVFLVSRVAEAHARGAGPGAAVVEAVACTGGMITSAGLVMITVFGGFVAGDFVLMKLLGFGLAAAVLLDITIVRLALGPALLVLAGRWNWWPGGRWSSRTREARVGIYSREPVTGIATMTVE